MKTVNTISNYDVYFRHPKRKTLVNLKNTLNDFNCCDFSIDFSKISFMKDYKIFSLPISFSCEEAINFHFLEYLNSKIEGIPSLEISGSFIDSHGKGFFSCPFSKNYHKIYKS